MVLLKDKIFTIFRKNELSNLEKKLIKLNTPEKTIPQKDLKTNILDWVENISSSYDFKYKQNKVERLFLNLFYEQGIIQDFEIDKAIENYVFKIATQNYNQAGINYADHCISPQYLAEGIVREHFSNSELSQIRFDHGDNQFNFYANYGDKNLISNLKKELLNPKIPIKKTPEKQLELFQEKKPNYDGHCCCCC